MNMVSVRYIEKGAGLNEAITSAGLLLRELNGERVTSEDQLDVVQFLIDDYSLADAADYVIKQVDVYAAKLRNKATAGTSPGEMASWSTKVEEAKAYQKSGLSTDAPSLSIEAAVRGTSIDDIVTRVLAGASRLMTLESMIAGTKGKHADAIRACATFEQISTYDWSEGWPEDVA